MNNQANRPALLVWTLTLAMFLLGLGLRLYDLTDPPLDFHYTRQLRGAIVARGIYYEMLPETDAIRREDAIAFGHSTGQYEPPLLESLVAVTYLLAGQEQLWVGRIYSSVFWIIGGIGLFALARRFARAMIDAGEAPTQRPAYNHLPGLAGLVALAYYLVLPFGVQASRSFQPDPGMVMWIILAVYALYRWMEIGRYERGQQNAPVMTRHAESWKWAILAGLLGGMAILTKTVAVYFLAGASIGTVLITLGWRRALRSAQVWCIALLMLIPSALFLAFQRGSSAAEYFQSWTVSLSHLLLEPGTYVRWLNMVQDLMGMTVLLLALIGILISGPGERALLLGLFGGYFVYGLTLPYQMYTHNYYHLGLIPLLALAIVPVATVILEKVWERGRASRVAFGLISLVAIGFPALTAISTLRAENFRDQPAYWEEIGSVLPRDGKVLALTPDYGYRLMYYGWRKVSLWPNRGQINLAELRGQEKEFANFFSKRIEGKGYFLIASLKQFNEQADLKAALTEGYPVYAEGDGFLIFDLQHPTSQ